jgi:MYXO-CTERM domain-containing protein
MHRAVKPILAAAILAFAGFAAAQEGNSSSAEALWVADVSAGQGSFAAGLRADDLSSAWAAPHSAVDADDSSLPPPAYALTLAGLAMMGALVRRRRRDTF